MSVKKIANITSQEEKPLFAQTIMMKPITPSKKTDNSSSGNKQENTITIDTADFHSPGNKQEDTIVIDTADFHSPGNKQEDTIVIDADSSHSPGNKQEDTIVIDPAGFHSSGNKQGDTATIDTADSQSRNKTANDTQAIAAKNLPKGEEKTMITLTTSFSQGSQRSPKKQTLRSKKKLLTRKLSPNKNPIVQADIAEDSTNIQAATNRIATSSTRERPATIDQDAVHNSIDITFYIWQQIQQQLQTLCASAKLQQCLSQALKMLQRELADIGEESEIYLQFYIVFEAQILSTDKKHNIEMPVTSALYQAWSRCPCNCYGVFFRFLSLLLYHLQKEIARNCKLKFAQKVLQIINNTFTLSNIDNGLEIFRHHRKFSFVPGRVCICSC